MGRLPRVSSKTRGEAQQDLGSLAEAVVSLHDRETVRNERFKIFGVRGGQASAGNDCGRSDHRVSPKAPRSPDGVEEARRFDAL
jgi:hypothetical protein